MPQHNPSYAISFLFSIFFLLFTFFIPTITNAQFDPIAAHEQLLSEATGYFKYAGGTGGKGGSIYYVTNLNNSGTGSMRDALTRTEPLIILFENGVNGAINLSSGIEIKSNKTLWGRHRDGSAANIYIDPNPNDKGLDISTGVSNVIIANFRGDASGPNDSAPDLIRVRDGASLAWIYHVSGVGDGTDNMDGFVDIRGENVTVSWSRAEDWSAVHLLNPSGGSASVTFDHNLYRNNRDRMPRTSVSTVRAHAYNNWLINWSSYGMYSTGGQIRAENNVFDAGSNTSAIRGPWGGGGNYFTNGATTEQSPGSVFTPPYSYTLDPVSTAAQAQALRDLLEAKAGWQSSFDDTPSNLPTLTFSASPSSITQGQPSTLSWSTTNATSCTASGGWSGSKGVSGSQSVSPSSTTTYTLSCSGAGGSVTQSAIVTVTAAPDTTPPSTPTNLSASAISSSQINLSWSASTDNVAVTGYRLERCQGSTCAAFTQIATPTGTTYSNTGLSANTTYRYRVRAADAAGNLSSYSTIASATTQVLPLFNFTLSNGGSKTVTQGNAVSNSISASLLSGSSQAVSFSAAGLPAGATASFSPSSCSPTCSSTLTIQTLSSTPTGTYTITVTAMGGGVTRQTSFSLTVNTLSGGNIIYVPQDYATISAAINAAGSGYTVLVSPGTYSETGAIAITKNLTLASNFINTANQNDITNTVIQGGGGNDLFIVSNGATVHIEGLTIENARKPITIDVGNGTIRNNVLRNNNSDAISFEGDSSGVAEFNVISNPGDDGIDIDGERGPYTIRGNTITGANDDGMEFRMINNYLVGGTLLYEVYENSIDGAGGDGIQLIDYPTDTENRRQINIHHNYIRNATYAGIGVMPNTQTNRGSLSELYPNFSFLERVYVTNNTIVDNDVGIAGGDNFIVLNNIISGNQLAAVNLDGSSRLDYTLLFNTSSLSGVPSGVQGSNILIANPLLSPTGSLQNGSPAIDAGVSSYTWQGENVLSVPLFNGSAPDLGWMESAGSSSPDTTPPSTPTNLSASAISSSQINLSWSASTDNIGVTQYRVERCQGFTCTAFTQIATPTGTTYSNTGLSANTTYRYRVRAADAAGNLSSYSLIVLATTQTSATTMQLFEAETFILFSPMSIGTDSNALGGKYIHVTSGVDSKSPVPEATHNFSVSTPGTYYLWARMMGPDGLSDALYVGIDTSWDRIFPVDVGSYEWVRVETTTGSGIFAFSLTSGAHTFQVGHGEINARLDGLYLTNDANDVPTFSPTINYLVGDLNLDGTVNNVDWAIMSAAWFTADPTADINGDGIVNSIDFSLLNRNWGLSS
jgi:chitodextrinase